MRLSSHPILEFKRGRKIYFYFEGQKIEAYEGEPIAAALHAAGIMKLSESLRFHRPRGFYCAIGKCSSCFMEVDGVPNVRTCITPVREGMQVRRQRRGGAPPLIKEFGYKKPEIPVIETELAIVGGGPAGLSAAIYAAREGIQPHVFDENFLLGGQLIKQTHKFFGSKQHYASVRGFQIAEILLNEARQLGVVFHPSSSVIGIYPGYELAVVKEGRLHRVKAKTVIVATGASEKMIPFEGNDLPGVFGAGGIQTLMNVYGIVPGKRVLMVGAGNIGVIVAYQLLQAGVEVAAVVEAMPWIGSYHVHAAKIRRMGVPILTRHTIKRALGSERVEAAEIVELDENWNPIEGTERMLEVDTVGLAVGLSPSVELLSQAGCRMVHIAELGGYVALHNHDMETTLPGVFIVGDAAGIEEASSAMMEGRLAGIAAVERIKGKEARLERMKEEIRADLEQLRAGPFGEKIRKGNEKLYRIARSHGIL